MKFSAEKNKEGGGGRRRERDASPSEK